MHHSNKNLAETCGIDIQPDNTIHVLPLIQNHHEIVVTPASVEEYLHNSDNIPQLIDNSHIDNTVQYTNASSINDQRNKTLFNIRFTSLGKRLSDRIENENEELNDATIGVSNSQNNGGKKSRQNSHVTFQNFQGNTFEIVPHRATRFSKCSSSSDVNLKALASCDSEDDQEDSDSCEENNSDSDVEQSVNFHLGSDRVTDALGENGPETQMFTDGTSERSSHFLNDSKENSIHEESHVGILSQNTSKLTPLFDKNIRLSHWIEANDASSKNGDFSKQDVHKSESTQLKRAKHKKSSEHVEFVNISNTDQLPDVVLVPSVITVVEVEKEPVKSSSEKSLLNGSVKTAAHQLQNVAFTEFVDIDDFQASVRSEISHAGDFLATKYEKQLEVLFRGGPNKSLKSYLRNSQWPAESGRRLHLWEQLCYHLWGSTLPSFVEPESILAYFLTAPGLEHVSNILCLLNHLHPDITFCPLLYPMACLFLHYMPPQACFNCLQALLHSNRSCYFHADIHQDTGLQVCPQRFGKKICCEYTRKFPRQAHDLMAQGGRKVEDIFDSWMWWIFRDLPFQYLVRIVDSFLLEGYKIFYRISLAIVILFAKGYNKTGSDKSSVKDFSADISSFCRNISVAPRKLIQVAFGIRGLSRREIAKLHEKNEALVSSLPTRKYSSKVRLKETVPSAILTADMLQQIWQWIPTRLSLMKPKLLFSSDEDGTAIRTLYTRTEYADQTILAVKTTNNEIFGAFCSTSWYTRHEKNKPKTSFFGTGETFVFTIVPDVKRYPWTGLLENPPNQTADLFMAGDDHMLMIGSGNGTAIYLDGMMNRGSSTHSDTFNNHPLCSTSDFSCNVVEVFGFIE
ncbi:unnamed protein product [Candidula unifasciata]|uniref:TLDc domain-containing protein n=1 Tax=Candidula unifasciata TaxID=100452 RepID=A0A8S3ZEE8_9EUPU|nr:unnamed protein product [Candidula unifasciata]